jgi:S1-C subfamily serine protease
MYRTFFYSFVVLGCIVPGATRAERRAISNDALVLQEAFQAAIAQAEPSVACILVSRSPRYKEFGAAPSADKPGQLGEFYFDYSKLDLLNEVERKLRKKEGLRLDLSSGSSSPESFGSGVVIDEKERLILTNYHVVLKATKVYVCLPGGKGSYANIHAADPRSDLAVLQLIKAVPLKAIKLGDGGKVKKGQLILGLANPYAAGFRDGSPSASWGIISNLRRLAPNSLRNELDPARSLHQYGTLLQTDAKISLGCSGGALIDLHGELIGLTTALAAVNGTDTPGGFAVPMDAGMKRVVKALCQGKEVEYSFLGVQFEPPFKVKGVVLSAVVDGSPASRELRPGDQIISMNGAAVNEIDDVVLPLATLSPGDTAHLVVKRPGVLKKIERNVVVVKFAVQGPIIATHRPEFRGIRVDYTSLLVQEPLRVAWQSTSIPTGVMVCEVKQGSQAAEVLKVGQVISRVNGHLVLSPAEFYEAVKGLKGPVELTLDKETRIKIN